MTLSVGLWLPRGAWEPDQDWYYLIPALFAGITLKLLVPMLCVGTAVVDAERLALAPTRNMGAREKCVVLTLCVVFLAFCAEEVPMGRGRYRICDSNYPYFVTCTAVKWLPLFADPDAAELVIDSLRFLQHERELRLYAYVVMENHLHLVVRSARLGDLMAQFKSFTARRIVEIARAKGRDALLEQLGAAKAEHKSDRDFQVWQEGFHPVCVQGAEMMRQKVEYVHQNPVRRGYVDLPEHWRYSSARNYAGLPAVLEIETAW